MGMLGTLIGIGLFVSGFLLGTKLTAPKPVSAPELTPEEVQAIKLERERLTKENEAFKQLMSYGVEQAYSGGPPKEQVMDD